MIEGKQEFKKVIRGAGENEVFINVQLSKGKAYMFIRRFGAYKVSSTV